MFTGPTAVLAALERVRATHPYTASGRIARTGKADADSASLWSRLLQSPTAERPAIIAALSAFERKLLLYGASARLADDGCLDVLASLFLLGDQPGGGRVAFEAYIVSDGRREFGPAARRHAERPTSPGTWQQIALDGQPVARACSMYLNSRQPFDEWARGDAVQLHRPDAIVRALLRRLLEQHRIAVLEREGLPTVESWLDFAFLDSETTRWFQQYLTLKQSRPWSLTDPVLIRIGKRFGHPERERPFWEDVPPEGVSAYEQWLRNVELTSLLGEGERVAFWRTFLPFMKRSLPSRCKEAVFIVFENWFAVQFVAMGKATYMFPSHHLLRMKRYEGSDLYRTVLDTLELGRYTHQGQYWQWKAESEVRRVMTEFGT